MSDSATPAAPALPAVSPGGGALAKGGIDGIKARLTGVLGQPAVARSLPMLGLVGVVGAAALAWTALREPPQRDLFRGLPDADKASVVDVLDKNAVRYRFDTGNGAITVAEDDYFKAKMMLASEGLPKSAPDGASMIDSMPMGASRAVESEKLRAAREMDLARTIEAIDSVESARIHLAVEPPSVFLRDRTKPQASVMLRLAQGRSLSDDQVRAIVHLVASSVPDLAPENVSVVDQNGHLLSNVDGAEGETDRQIAVQSRIEERYRQSVIALLTPIIGAGKFSTEVHAEVNFNERQATRETYPQDEARLRNETGTWQATKPGDKADGGEAGGIPGALSNQAPAPAQAGTQAANVQQAGAATDPASASANGQTQPELAPLRTQESYNRSFELGREVSVTREAVGTVRRLSVAVALDNGPDGKPRKPEEIAALEALVKSAVGFDQGRGDMVALSNRGFVKLDEAQVTPFYEADWFKTLSRNLSALAVAAILIFGIGRPLLKKWSNGKKAEEPVGKVEEPVAPAMEGEALSKEISQELVRSAQENPDQMVTLDMISSTPDYAQRADLIRNFVKQDPDRAALVVRDLLRENSKAKENA